MSTRMASMTKEDARNVLGLGEIFSEGELRAAYLKCVKEWHPDLVVMRGGTQDELEQANRKVSTAAEAHRVLKRMLQSGEIPPPPPQAPPVPSEPTATTRAASTATATTANARSENPSWGTASTSPSHESPRSERAGSTTSSTRPTDWDRDYQGHWRCDGDAEHSRSSECESYGSNEERGDLRLLDMLIKALGVQALLAVIVPTFAPVIGLMFPSYMQGADLPFALGYACGILLVLTIPIVVVVVMLGGIVGLLMVPITATYDLIVGLSARSESARKVFVLLFVFANAAFLIGVLGPMVPA